MPLRPDALWEEDDTISSSSGSNFSPGMLNIEEATKLQT